MPLFIDSVLSSSPHWGRVGPEFAMLPDAQWEEQCRCISATVRAAQVFDITNVADYLYEGSSKEVYDLWKDFPRPMPPFMLTWFEWRTPLRILRQGQLEYCSEGRWFDFHGSLVVAIAREKDDYAYRIVIQPFARKRGEGTVGILPSIHFALTEQFEVVPPLGTPETVGAAWPGLDYSKWEEARGDLMEAWEYSSTIMHVPLLAMSLLNCRNVVTKDLRIPEALQRKHAKRGHPLQAVRYSVIEIQPIIHSVQKATGQRGYGRAAATIVRGHFKDYQSGKGLFGKYKGLFWWDQRTSLHAKAEYHLKSKTGPLDEAWKRDNDARLKP